MKSRLILQQHMPYAQMLEKALDFCESMLKHTPTLYPFALLNIAGVTHSIFVPNTNQLAQPKMIESLQTHIDAHKVAGLPSTSLLGYAATVSHPHSGDSDALVFTITDTQGQNTVIIYPYTHIESGINVGQPYTCDFSD